MHIRIGAPVIAILLLIATGFSTSICAGEKSFGESAAKFIGGYLLGKVIDGIWDSATGKPDVAELQNRIDRLESSLGGSSLSLDALRGAIHDDMSVDEYQRLVSTALPGIANLLSDHERRLRVLEGTIANTQGTDATLRVGSYWTHNGSVMGLLAQDNRRIFVYVKPRSGLQGLVQPGTVLFSGATDSNSYSGKARRFSRGLPPIEYTVSGPIQNSGERVVLNGKATVRNPDGSIKKAFNDVLIFDLISLNK